MFAAVKNLASSVVSNSSAPSIEAMGAVTDHLPVYFLSHGSPMWAIEENETAKFFEREGKNIATIADKFDGVVVISAHWETRGALLGNPSVKVTAKDGNLDLIYDFYGFPRELYEVKYPVSGSAAIANRVINAVASKGIEIAADPSRGVDHGFWVPIKKMFDPSKKTPMVQLSLAGGGDYAFHLRLGAALAPLAKPDPASGRKGLLFITSGSATHNLRLLNFENLNSPPDAWAKKFNDDIAQLVTQVDIAPLLDAVQTSPAEYSDKWMAFVQKDPALLKKAHPSLEHLMPLVVALGIASGAGCTKGLWVHRKMYSNLSGAGYRFE
ncbi:hypothetical protein HDU84_008593 [Entophlyctis sp. JEL0112]|nr:hypothetical protein HDU84_008593 [Entophlyctis sp. JEL0112]